MLYKNLLQQFQAMPKNKKISFVMMISLLVCLTAGLILWQVSPNYSVLFNHLDSDDANQIVQQLESQDIGFKVTDHGSTVLVDKTQVEKLRLKLMAEGMRLKGGIGFEIFDRSDFGMTEFSQKINYQRALQGELERTIASLKEVKSARVHLVLPEQHLFEKSNPPTAAVTLHLKPYQQLNQKQVQGIQNLLAASVAKLSLKNIVIVDSKGNTLSRQQDDKGLNSHFQAKKQLENYLTKKVMPLLHSIFDDQKVMVNIDVALNYDSLEKSTEHYLPESSNSSHDGLLTHIKEVKHSKGEKKQQRINDVTIEKSYQYGRQIEKQHVASGNIKFLTVSVIVPQETSDIMRGKIENVVKNAIGFDSSRGDKISVEALTQTQQPSILPLVPHVNPPKNPLTPWFLLSMMLFGVSLLGFGVWYIKTSRRRNQLLQELTLWMEKNNA